MDKSSDKYNMSMKVNKNGKDFLDKLRSYRRSPDLQNPDKKDLDYGKIIEVFKIFFVKNPTEYKNLIKTEWKKNA